MNRKIDIYFNFADYVKILTTYTFFTFIYKKKINNFICGISIILLILCNINFTIEQLLEKSDDENDNQNNKIFNKYYKKLFSWIKEDKLIYIQKYSQYFSELLVISYFIGLMIIIHYMD